MRTTDENKLLSDVIKHLGYEYDCYTELTTWVKQFVDVDTYTSITTNDFLTNHLSEHDNRMVNRITDCESRNLLLTFIDKLWLTKFNKNLDVGFIKTRIMKLKPYNYRENINDCHERLDAWNKIVIDILLTPQLSTETRERAIDYYGNFFYDAKTNKNLSILVTLFELGLVQLFPTEFADFSNMSRGKTTFLKEIITTIKSLRLENITSKHYFIISFLTYPQLLGNLIEPKPMHNNEDEWGEFTLEPSNYLFLKTLPNTLSRLPNIKRFVDSNTSMLEKLYFEATTKILDTNCHDNRKNEPQKEFYNFLLENAIVKDFYISYHNHLTGLDNENVFDLFKRTQIDFYRVFSLSIWSLSNENFNVRDAINNSQHQFDAHNVINSHSLSVNLDFSTLLKFLYSMSEIHLELDTYEISADLSENMLDIILANLHTDLEFLSQLALNYDVFTSIIDEYKEAFLRQNNIDLDYSTNNELIAKLSSIENSTTIVDILKHICNPNFYTNLLLEVVIKLC